MVDGDLPELRRESDLNVLRDHLMLDLSDEEADKEFRRMLDGCLSDQFTKLNNLAHVLKHAL